MITAKGIVAVSNLYLDLSRSNTVVVVVEKVMLGNSVSKSYDLRPQAILLNMTTNSQSLRILTAVIQNLNRLKHLNKTSHYSEKHFGGQYPAEVT